MDLRTDWMGLSLSSPLVAGASPLSDDLDASRALEDNGASALVMHSLFMEQIEREQRQLAALEEHYESHLEASSYFPEPAEFALGPHEYLEQVRRLKDALDIPVIGSLNGISAGPWVRYAGLIAEAGADALELNLYYLPLTPDEAPGRADQHLLDVLAAVREAVDLPIAVKLTYFHSAPVYLARKLAEGGAKGLVLFNRIFHADLDIEELELVPRLHLETPSNLKMRMMWVAAMWGQVEADLAISGGVRTVPDVVAAVMSGATVTQLTSPLLSEGPDYLHGMTEELARWGDEHDYESLDQMRGSMSLLRCPDPEAYERGNYIRTLQMWRKGR